MHNMKIRINFECNVTVEADSDEQARANLEEMLANVDLFKFVQFTDGDVQKEARDAGIVQGPENEASVEGVE